MDKIKILFCVDTLLEDQDGVSNTYHRIFESMPSNVEARVITPQPPKSTEFNFPIHTCPSIPFPFYPDYRLAIPELSSMVGQIFKTFQPDLIHWSTPSPLGRYAVSFGRKQGIPITTIYHTHFNGYANLYLKCIPGITTLSRKSAWPILNFYRKTDRILVPSSSMESFLWEAGVAPEKIRRWGRGIDCEKFNSKHRDPSFLKTFNLPDQPTILFVGRLVKIKDTDTLLSIYEQCKSNFNFIIVGKGPDRKRLEKRMPEAVFCGHLTGMQLARAYASCDLFVFPSTTETFGNVVLEAMASGIPVIAADEGGPGDIITHEHNGLLVEPGNAEAFVKACQSLTHNRQKAQHIKIKALNHARNQTWDSLRQQLFEHFYSLHASR